MNSRNKGFNYEMSPESELVLVIAKEMVYPHKDGCLPIISKRDIDWLKFKDSLVYHRLLPFAYISLKEYFYLLPEDFVRSLEANYYHSLRHILHLEQRFLDLYSAFAKKGIVFIPIKGVALLEDLYAHLPVRSSVDIDVLVKEEDVEEATVLLEGLGFKKELGGFKESYWRERNFHFAFVKKEADGFWLIVELHWLLDYPRRIKLLSKIFKRLRKFKIQNIDIDLLSVEDTFFTLALHHRRPGIGLALRDVCDIAMLLNKYKFSFDWDYLLKESRKSELRSTVFFCLSQARLLLGIDIPEYVWQGLGIAAWKRRMLRRFIEKNTFLPKTEAMSEYLFLKEHFMLYDNPRESIGYILNIPQEQFAKFYGLTAYGGKTNFLYHNRLFYMPFKAACNLLKI